MTTYLASKQDNGSHSLTLDAIYRIQYHNGVGQVQCDEERYDADVE